VGWLTPGLGAVLGVFLSFALLAGVMGHVAWLSLFILNSSLSIFVSYPLVVCLGLIAFEVTMKGIMYLMNWIS
jgi:hypothetical protein